MVDAVAEDGGAANHIPGLPCAGPDEVIPGHAARHGFHQIHVFRTKAAEIPDGGTQIAAGECLDGHFKIPAEVETAVFRFHDGQYRLLR